MTQIRMSAAMRMIIGDLSVGNARGWGGFGAGVYSGAGVQHAVTQTPANQFSIPRIIFYLLIFSSISLILHLFHFIFIFFL